VALIDELVRVPTLPIGTARVPGVIRASANPDSLQARADHQSRTPCPTVWRGLFR
jgi:hypothetical protein